MRPYGYPWDSPNFGVSARAYYKAGGIPIIVCSSIFLAATIALALVQLKWRKPQEGHSRVGWHVLRLATASLAFSHAVNLGVTGALLADGDLDHFRYQIHYYGPLFTALFSGLHTIFILIACKAVFYEVTAHKIFFPHERGRWVSIVADAVLFFVIQGSLFATTFAVNLCEAFGNGGWYACYPNAVDYVLVSIVNPQISWGFPIAVFLEYGNILVSSFFATRWARKAEADSPVSAALTHIVSPLLALQMFACIATMAVGLHIDTQSKALEYFVSLPYWILQIVVLGTLLGMLRTRKLLVAAPSNLVNAPSAS
ncbi:hypothetical protein AURDEDRAFT_185999 [Auricularia subglabra TFB-10046 SS5]|nr:hypothetical protein AURDEDRAFT_185999 [Auricularia subglabra TFB-10046 SS5]